MNHLTQIIVALIVVAAPLSSGRADIPKDIARVIRDHEYARALNLLETRYKTVSENDRDERFQTLGWMTLVSLAQGVDALERVASGEPPKTETQILPDHDLGSLGLESIEELQAFKPLNALLCTGLSVSDRAALMGALYDADPSELTCPYGIQKTGVDVSNKARYFLGSALLATSAVLWDNASRYPRKYMDVGELYTRALLLRRTVLTLLKDKTDNWGKKEKVNEKKDEVKPKGIYYDLAQSPSCRKSPDIEEQMEAILELSEEERAEHTDDDRPNFSKISRSVGRLQAEGRRMGTVQFTEAERGNYLAAYAMISEPTLDAFKANIQAQANLHASNRDGGKTIPDWIQCTTQRLQHDVTQNLGLMLRNDKLRSEALIEQFASITETLRGSTPDKSGASDQLKYTLAFVKAENRMRQGQAEDAHRFFREGLQSFFDWHNQYGKSKKEPDMPIEVAGELVEFLPAYAKLLGPAGRNQASMKKALDSVERWHGQVLASYAEEVKELKKTAGLTVWMNRLRKVNELSQKANKTIRGINELAKKIPFFGDRSPKRVPTPHGVPEQVTKSRGASKHIPKLPGVPGMSRGDGKMLSELPELAPDVQEGMLAIEALNDLKPTSVEKIRKLDNQIRKLQLDLAFTYLHLGDVKRAETLLDETEPYGNVRDHNAFVSALVSYEWYLRAKLAAERGRMRKAEAAYSVAVDYFYFAPRSRWQVYEHSTFLLEEVARAAFEDDRPLDVLRYSELVRGVQSDSPSLFHFLPEKKLKAFQTRLETDFQQLRRVAGKNAREKGQREEFAQMDEGLDERLGMSTRRGESPLSPQYVALEKLLPYLEDKDIRRYVRQLEVFLALWESRAVAKHRARFLTAEAKRSVGSFELPSDKAWGKEAMSSMFADKGGKGGGPPPEVVAVRRALPKDTAFLSYWLTADHLFVVAGNRRAIEARMLPLQEHGLVMLRGNLSLDDEGFRKELYDKMVAPFEDKLRRRVVVLASGALRRLPFAALSNPKTGQYFGDAHLVRNLPTLMYLLGSAQNPRRDQSVRIMAPWDVVPGRPLPRGAEEAQMVRRIFPGQLLSGHSVTRDALNEALPDAGIFHFAGHAIVEQNVPDFTRLMIGGGASKTAHGYFVHDIKDQRLDNMQLAVLSACTSGAGPEVEGKGFSSLSAAFLFAGVDSVVSSIEPVDDDQTNVLMQAFYRHLANGLPKDVALQKAQQQVRAMDARSRGWSEMGWAAFSLSGDPVAVARRRSGS